MVDRISSPYACAGRDRPRSSGIVIYMPIVLNQYCINIVIYPAWPCLDPGRHAGPGPPSISDHSVQGVGPVGGKARDSACHP